MRSPLLAAVLVLVLLAVTPAVAFAAGGAPGGPGVPEQFLPADKSGLGTARAATSPVWFTVQREGGLGEIYYPDLGTPSARALQFAVADRHGHATRAQDAIVETSVDDALTFRQTFRDRGGRWRLAVTYVTDPARATVLLDVRFTGPGHDLFAIYDPALGDTRDDDSGSVDGDALVARDASTASALAAEPGFAVTSNGFRGTSDGWTDLARDGRLDWHYPSAAAGNLVQTGRLAAGHTTIALGFGATGPAALGAARASLRAGFDRTARAYAQGWRAYLAGLHPAPAVADRRLYQVSAMVLAASEDKAHPGAYVAAPNMPWIWGSEAPSGPYHLVWSRDLYQIATGLIAAGDTAGAGRALDFLFTVQQRPDGSFPQNSSVAGVPVWTGLQLDEVALPIVLAYQLGRTDPATWTHVRAAAEFLLSFEGAPATPQERWENQSGYSPATIAAEIAGLVCAASLAPDAATAARYRRAADEWAARVKGWTVTTTGPYSRDPYFLRLTKDGNPDAGTTYSIGDSGPSAVDQRRVVDPSFLELVRLGVLPADDAAVVNSLSVVDAQLGTGAYWHRASFDGYGEERSGAAWSFPLPADSYQTLGRAWPLLNGERGEYLVAAGDLRGARAQLAAMGRAAGPGLMLPEQVWDDRPPAGTPGFVPGTPTFSATPLAWTHAQYIRLAWGIASGRVVEQPAAVADRYLG
ncbi:glycoside hydrolase family 15 protein [Dactylosporangium sp. CS-033363]|uniref:glycoside hydrolase family 15 protein n=1 Tax=Dactylosporangium sp. CS-033363 TaxID=3239935 RepID=UPI003D920F9C